MDLWLSGLDIQINQQECGMRIDDRKDLLRGEESVVECRVREGGAWVALRCSCWGRGSYPVPADTRYEHPAPAFNRLFLFHRGGCRVETARKDFELASGVIHLLPVNLPFRVTYRGGSLFDFFHLKVEGALGRDVFDGLRGVHALAAPELFAEITGNIADGFRRQMALGQAAWRFCEAHWEHVAPRLRPPGALESALRHLRDHLSPSLSVTELADHAHWSRATLNRLFRRHLGMSVKAYALDLLLQRAKEQLASGDAPVKAVAAALGYEDAFYFQRLFKRKTGLTPTAFRKQAATQR